MKIGKPNAPAASVQSERVRRPRASDRIAETAPIDEVMLLGVPRGELTPKVQEILVSLIDDIKTLRAELDHAKSRINELETIADRDPMLDVLNRRAFTRELDRALAMIDRYPLRASLIFVDVNDLKEINDNKGHAAGDAALAHVAGLLSANVRQTDVVARLGGDEFALLLFQADEELAAAKATAISALVAKDPVEWDGAPFSASISWGAVEIGKGVSAKEALNRADEAMYEAKKRK